MSFINKNVPLEKKRWYGLETPNFIKKMSNKCRMFVLLNEKLPSDTLYFFKSSFHHPSLEYNFSLEFLQAPQPLK
jgi:hypothetical protein